MPGPLGFLSRVIGLLSIVAWGITILVSIVRALFRRNWNRAVGFPAIVICALPLIFIGAISGDYVHLTVLSPSYVYKIRQQPDWPSRETRFGWGDDAITVLDGMQLKVLVYDPTGKTQVGEGPGPDGGLRTSTRHLIGNFYLLYVYTG